MRSLLSNARPVGAALAVAGLTIASLTAAEPAAAEQYNLSTWLEPNHIITRKAHVEWAEAVKQASGGAIDFQVFVGGALIPAKSTMQGTADGIAQVGFHTATYTPSDLPVSNALADMGFKTPDAFVMAFAYSDFMMHEAAGYQDWRKNGVIFGGGYSTPIYYFLCRGENRTLADFKGKRVRMPGGGWARFGQHIGVVGVNVPSSEIYTAFERGSVDCTASDPTHLTSGATLMEVVDSVTLLKMSPFYAGVTWAYNVPFWQGLTDAQRRLLFDESAKAMVRMEVEYDKNVEAALAAARQKGVKLIEPDATLQQSYDQWVADGIGGVAEIAKEKHGIQDPAALFASFEPYMTKWVGLMKGVDRHDEAALTKLVKAEIYDTLDVSKYGME
ncbi:TRAP-type C4-dicarboxylate transport system, substrate-binding protein [Tistlia consotensis]|uniref:TRAP-type C4-dicarboxylate transport system, substrate-binding protein n=1 Tax=Tistlia consotensis USBA 355 TaxID=560819 RepID=A0A1Y6BXX3_9PROT|nr:C4-dicarboxylate TRAP transporter substrate-binding protein [Tistlia consotensis]SMF35553.1 TRAP-type C4-dicarboxylate transport system, substrate-binding protein [Tistlia consotensis USBA 355]SNR70924.1 TRAP-type C4-dicarboxylate transport system, substrate-binding protein [Tistlia consotensis]